ncbi:hypothetical protein [Microbacterium sp. NPDC056234]|uniref:hypothetical protein n=1 Tax=Microbacterium sp. NPDC056234 TaxID=3345757 RepID=UPI0035DC005B
MLRQPEEVADGGIHEGLKSPLSNEECDSYNKHNRTHETDEQAHKWAPGPL